MEWVLKALLGAGAVIVIQLFARSKNFAIAGLVPLFPTFALIAHYLVGTQRGTPELKQTIVFGMLAIIPYMLYLTSLYFMVDRMKLPLSLTGATVVWFISAAILITVWSKTVS